MTSAVWLSVTYKRRQCWADERTISRHCGEELCADKRHLTLLTNLHGKRPCKCVLSKELRTPAVATSLDRGASSPPNSPQSLPGPSDSGLLHTYKQPI